MEKKIAVPNTPKYTKEILKMIVDENPNLAKDIEIGVEGELILKNEEFFSEENIERLVNTHKKLITAILAFEEALLYIS